MTLHVIYRIRNLVNEKSYIGQTNSPDVRKSDHFRDLKSGKHHSKRLQSAYRKYGRPNFIFEILEGAITSDGINSREIYWIAYYDSFHGGYNMSEGGDKPAPGVMKSCIWNGIEYPSVADGIRANGNSTAIYAHIRKGYMGDHDIKPYSRPVIWNSVEYPSINQAAIACGIDVTSMRERLINGYTKDTDVIHSVRSCIWDGVTYETVSESAKANNVKMGTMWQWINNGYTSSTDITTNEIPITWNGIEYQSQSAAARSLGITPTAMRQRLNMGYTCDDDMPFRRK